MEKSRLLSFTDDVVAIIITIMALELKQPNGDAWAALVEDWPLLLGYMLSYVYVGIYWSNHHHLFQLVRRIDGRTIWANLGFLFCLSLFPFATAWLSGTEPKPAVVPTICYGILLLATALSWMVLLRTLIAVNGGEDSGLREVYGTDRKGILSLAVHAIAIGIACYQPKLSCVLYGLVAAAWFIPDPRVEARLKQRPE